MKNALLLAFIVGAGACTHQGPVYNWYHPLGGEFLFAFDANECRSAVAELGQQLGVDPSGPFFKCMENRGYSLVTAGNSAGDTQSWADLVVNESK